jgi:hypothetical protein
MGSCPTSCCLASAKKAAGTFRKSLMWFSNGSHNNRPGTGGLFVDFKQIKTTAPTAQAANFQIYIDWNTC